MTEIGVDGDRFCGLTKIGGLERRCGACDGYGVDRVLALVLLGFERERKKKKEEEKKEETAEIRKKKEDERKASLV